MTDAFSEYVTLLDAIEEIPVAARLSPRLPTEQRAATMAHVIDLVRDRVLPQSDRDEARLEALFDGRARALAGSRGDSGADRDAILALADELARTHPNHATRIQKLLYRLHRAIADHFGEAEVMLTSAQTEQPGIDTRSRATSEGSVSEGRTGPSCWFG